MIAHHRVIGACCALPCLAKVTDSDRPHPTAPDPDRAWGFFLLGVNRRANWGGAPLTAAETVALPLARAYARALSAELDAAWDAAYG